MVAKFGQLRSFTRPENGGTADVYGFEVAVQRQLDFLPGFLKGFGVYLNYTLPNRVLQVSRNVRMMI